jgi:hypothetical protein
MGVLQARHRAAEEEGLVSFNHTEVQSALSVIPADDRERWVKIGMAIKSGLGEAGFALFDEWSQTDESYDARDAQSVWRSISVTGGISIKALFFEARSRGWRGNVANGRLNGHSSVKIVSASQDRPATREAQAIWESAVPVESHPYLEHKAIHAHGLRLFQGSRTINGVDCRGALIMPLRDSEGRTSTVEFIAANGAKRYLPGGKVSGCYFLIGEITDRVIVAEGFATGASIFEATGLAVAVATNAGNMRRVAHALRGADKDVKIVFAADHDETGIREATRAALEVGGLLALPEIEGQDFNDVARSAGPSAVVEAIARARVPQLPVLDPNTTPAEEPPPLTAYADEDAAIGREAAKAQDSHHHGGVLLRSAAQIVASPAQASWLIRDVLERLALAVMYGDLGTYKSFLALDWCLHLAAGKSWAERKTQQCAAVYISAEGRGMPNRLRAWCLHHRVDVATLPFYAVEHLIDLSSNEGVQSLVVAIEALGIRPGIIVIDTLSRNCGPLNEDKSSDMAPWLNRLDEYLRVRYGCTVLLVHHVGNQEKGRTRGSYAILANTDSSYRIERPDQTQPIIKIVTGRLKDSEAPEPIYLTGQVVELGTQDADGRPESSLVLAPTHSRPAEAHRKPTGKRMGQILDHLEAEYRRGNKVWTAAEIQNIAKQPPLSMHRNSARDAWLGLVNSGFLKSTIGGSTLVNPPGE